MFFLHIERAEQGHSENAAKRNHKIVSRDGFRIRYACDDLYGFAVESEDYFVVGEIEISNDMKFYLDRLQGFPRVIDFLNKPESHVCDYAIINFKTKKLIFRQSLSCNRPVYYRLGKHEAYISTHIKALRDAGIRLVPAKSVTPEFMAYRYVTAPRTLYQDISRLIGGQTLTYDLTNGEIVSDEKPPFAELVDVDLSTPESAGEISDNILSDTLGTYYKSSFKTAITLSGGLDSTALAAVAKYHGAVNPEDLTTVSSCFSFIIDNEMESQYARTAADDLKLKHKVFTSSDERYLAAIVDSIYHAEEPIHHLQSAMLYLMFGECRELSYDQVISGEGSDGLFGNDLHVRIFNNLHRLDMLTRMPVKPAIRMLHKSIFRNDDRFRFFSHDFGRNIESPEHIFWTYGRYGNREIIREIHGCKPADIFRSRLELMKSYSDRSLLESISIMALLTEGYQTMTLWSKLGEAAGVRVLYPFTYPTLVRAAVSIPWSVKLQEQKYIIRQILRKYSVSEDIITRPKRSFGFPPSFWALPNRIFQPFVDMLSEMFDRKLIQKVQDERIDRAMILWGMINLFLWKKMMIDGVDPADLKKEVLGRKRRLETPA